MDWDRIYRGIFCLCRCFFEVKPALFAKPNYQNNNEKK